MRVTRSRPWIIYWILHGLELLDALPEERFGEAIGEETRALDIFQHEVQVHAKNPVLTVDLGGQTRSRRAGTRP